MRNKSENPKVSLKEEILKIINDYTEDYKNSGVELKYDFITVKSKSNSVHRKDSCIIIKFQDAYVLTNSVSRKRSCKEYSFIISNKKKKKENTKFKVAKTLERFLKRKLRELHKRGPKKLCQNSIFDFLKFVFVWKYSYKEKFCGVDIKIITFIFAICCSLIILVLRLYARYQYFLEYGHYPLW